GRTCPTRVRRQALGGSRPQPRSKIKAQYFIGANKMRTSMKAVIAVVLGTALFSAALAVSQADAAYRKHKARLSGVIPPTAAVVQPPSDRFMACDVRVRDYLREGGAVVRVTKIEVDDARLQLNIQHEYGEAGRTNRKYLRGDGEEEMRRDLRGLLD